MGSHSVLLTDGGSIIRKEWACVYGDYILLKAETKPALKEKMGMTRLPDGAEVIALPKTYGTAFI